MLFNNSNSNNSYSNISNSIFSSDCSNYRSISLINIGLKIVSKIITNRMSSYALTHNFIRPEQFGFSQS